MSINTFMIPEHIAQPEPGTVSDSISLTNPQNKLVLYRDLNINKWNYGIEIYEYLYKKYELLQKLIKLSLMLFSLYPCIYLLFYNYIIFDINIAFCIISLHIIITCLLYIYVNHYIFNYHINNPINITIMRLFNYPIDTITPIYISSNCNYQTYNTKNIYLCLVIQQDYMRNITYILSKEKKTNKYIKMIVENDFMRPYLDYIDI